MSGYIGQQPVALATQTRDAFTATAAQTSFATRGYTPGYLDVYLNGVKLAAADYTATNNSDVVLTVGAALNDILEVVAYSTFEAFNETFTGTTTVDILAVTGTVDGRDVAVDGAKLDLIDQGVATTDSPTLGGLTVTGTGDTLVTVSSTGTGDADARLDLDAGDTGEPEIRFRSDGVVQANISMTGGAAGDFNISTAAASGRAIDFQPNNTLAMRVTPAGNVGIGTDSPSEALTVIGSSVVGDSTTSYNQFTVNGFHVGDGGNDYGITVNSFEPAITLLDRSTGGGSGQMRVQSDGAFWFLRDSTNDGTIGHDSNTTDSVIAKLQADGTVTATSYAGDGSALTGLDTAAAGLAAGAVGTYAFLIYVGQQIVAGTTFAGSSLLNAAVNGVTTSTALDTAIGGTSSQLIRGDAYNAGTWRAMGSSTYQPTTTHNRATLFLRVS